MILHALCTFIEMKKTKFEAEQFPEIIEPFSLKWKKIFNRFLENFNHTSELLYSQKILHLIN